LVTPTVKLTRIPAWAKLGLVWQVIRISSIVALARLAVILLALAATLVLVPPTSALLL
jgi:hypothetical protein